MKACAKCGCTEKRACLEFDALGYAHPCYWLSEVTCSACFPELHRPPAEEDVETRIVVALGKRKRGFLRVPELAGMVARPRR